VRYFNYHDFDSPDAPGSGHDMDPCFLEMLDMARMYAGIPFVVTSGFRTKQYNNELKRKGYKTSNTSAHLLGKACDIACTTSADRFLIISGALEAGFTRIGIASSFIHLDNATADDDKIEELIWIY
jgi:uncharacterized protein YcbK (DUF882 family)